MSRLQDTLHIHGCQSLVGQRNSDSHNLSTFRSEAAVIFKTNPIATSTVMSRKRTLDAFFSPTVKKPKTETGAITSSDVISEDVRDHST